MLKAGVSTACLYPKVVEEALYDLAIGGVQHVEIFINTHSELHPTFIASLAHILRRFDMTCKSLHPFTSELEPLMLFSGYERRLQDVLEYYKRYFSAMQMLGATVFVLHGNKGPIQAELYAERFAMLAELGKTFGVVVAQENVARCTSRSLDFLLQMQKLLGNDAKFVLDIKQAVRSNETPMQMLQKLGSHIVHVHLSDHGEYGDCLPVGTGRFDVRTFLQTLSTCSPDCSVILELYRSSFNNVQDLVNNYLVIQHMLAPGSANKTDSIPIR